MTDKSAHLDPDKNPKHAAGRLKPSLRHLPPSALFYEGRVMDSGAAKYGPFNWGEAGVVASVYFDAISRHLFAWYTGEEIDPESGQPHMAHIRACAGIIIDCTEIDNLKDDRPVGKTAPVAELLAKMIDVTPKVKAIDEDYINSSDDIDEIIEARMNVHDFIIKGGTVE